jgi:hypothetical protein
VVGGKCIHEAGSEAGDAIGDKLHGKEIHRQAAKYETQQDCYVIGNERSSYPLKKESDNQVEVAIYKDLDGGKKRE